ncbi:MAG TPA: cell division protein FtsL [Nitrospiraceae bacterium]|nr:cell division protein FtsL [Nitrospiraceae bacterium]
MKTLTVVAAMGLLLLYVWERVEIVRIGYQIERLKVKKVALERERDELQVKLSALTSPERIARVATEKLGLVPPQRGQVILVNVNSEGPIDRVPAMPEVKLARNEPVEKVP